MPKLCYYLFDFQCAKSLIRHFFSVKLHFEYIQGMIEILKFLGDIPVISLIRVELLLNLTYLKCHFDLLSERNLRLHQIQKNHALHKIIDTVFSGNIIK